MFTLSLAGQVLATVNPTLLPIAVAKMAELHQDFYVLPPSSPFPRRCVRITNLADRPEVDIVVEPMSLTLWNTVDDQPLDSWMVSLQLGLRGMEKLSEQGGSR